VNRNCECRVKHDKESEYSHKYGYDKVQGPSCGTSNISNVTLELFLMLDFINPWIKVELFSPSAISDFHRLLPE